MSEDQDRRSAAWSLSSMSSRVVTAVAAGLILAVLLGWCGIRSDGASTDTPEQAAPTSAPRATSQTITTATVHQASTTSTSPPVAAAAVSPETSTLVGGCEPFTVFAQNRWDDPGLGARVNAEPFRGTDRVGGFGPNVEFKVDGWVHTVAPYPTNDPPFDSDVWFHVPSPDGWVAYAAVRPGETKQYPTPQANGDPGVELMPECEGEYRPR